MAAPINLGSLAIDEKEAVAGLFGSAQVNDAQIMPVLYPRTPNTIPTTAYCRDKISCLRSLLRKYFTACTTDTVKSIIMLNHMHTWKYKLRIDSWMNGLRGTGSSKPPMIA